MLRRQTDTSHIILTHGLSKKMLDMDPRSLTYQVRSISKPNTITVIFVHPVPFRGLCQSGDSCNDAVRDKLTLAGDAPIQ